MNQDGDLTALLYNLNQSTVIQIVLVLAAAWGLMVAVQRLLPRLAERFSGTNRQYVLASVPMLRLGIIAGTIVLIAPRVIEPTFENLLALLGAAGLAIGFAMRDYVSSLIAGIVVLYEMPYRPGDWVEIEGTYGEVRSIGMRTLKMVTPDDTVVIIPHLKLWDRLICNANDGSRNLLCVANFHLHPHHQAAAVKHALYDVAVTSPFVQLQRPITVTVQDKVWGTHYRLKAYPIDPRDQFQFLSDLTVRGKAVLTDLGLVFVAAPPAAVEPG